MCIKDFEEKGRYLIPRETDKQRKKQPRGGRARCNQNRKVENRWGVKDQRKGTSKNCEKNCPGEKPGGGKALPMEKK